jgi:glycosyltransferase involved in cell wall biosynthesis
MSEQVSHGETGFFTDPDNPTDVAAQLTTLLNDTKQRRRLGEHARERVCRENDPGVIGRQLVEVLREITDDRGSGDSDQ